MAALPCNFSHLKIKDENVKAHVTTPTQAGESPVSESAKSKPVFQSSRLKQFFNKKAAEEVDRRKQAVAKMMRELATYD